MSNMSSNIEQTRPFEYKLFYELVLISRILTNIQIILFMENM
jgi:hypothetical protein